MTINHQINTTLALKHCRHGLIAYRSNDKYLGKCLDEYGEFSMGEVEIFQRYITREMTVIDCGSNIGILTVEMSKLAKVVISLEAERLLYQMTCANLALNDRRNVIALHAAAGKDDGAVHVPNINFDVDANFGCMQAEGHTAGDAVRLMRLDSMKLDNCGFIKIDVEGMERDVLIGAGETIKKFRPILYVENDRKEKSHALISCIMALGYTIYWHFPPLCRKNNFAGKTGDIFPGVASLNLICFPDDREFKEGYRITDPDQWWESLKVVHAKEVL